jgi:hypothetical protein
MKLKSFLFLAAALAIGLAFASCGGDTEQLPGDTIKQGYASDADAIRALFNIDGINDVYLSKAANLAGAELSVPDGKTLHVNNQTVTVDSNTVILLGKTTGWDWGSGTASQINAGTTTPLLIGFPEVDANEYAHYAAGTTGIIFAGANGALTPHADGYVIATKTLSDIINDAGTLTAIGGTKAYFVGDITNKTFLKLDTGGTLTVTGNLTGLQTLITTTPLTVYGELSGGTATAGVEVISGAGPVTAKKATITGGTVAAPLTVETNSTFGAASGGFHVTFTSLLTAKKIIGTAADVKATFDSAATFTGGAGIDEADFNDDATFTTTAPEITKGDFGGDVTFVDGSKVDDFTIAANKVIKGGNVHVSARLNAPTDGLIFAENGGIIVATGLLSPTVNGPGTFAVIGDDAGTLKVTSGNIEVSGDGTLGVSNTAIELYGNSTFVFSNTGGILFNDTDSKITGSEYVVGGEAAGTLLSDQKVKLTATGIEKGDSTDPTITFGENAVFLTVSEGKILTIKDANIDVSSKGSISFSPDAMVYLASGGTITAAGSAHTGYIISIGAANGGSLVAGSLGGSMSADSIAAGSVGTVGSDLGGNFIISTSDFAVGADESITDSSATAAGYIADSTPHADISTTGSIGVFGKK